MDTRPFSARLTSRRFLITLAVAIIVTVGEKFGISLDETQLLALAGVAAAYNLKDAVSKPTTTDG